MKSILIRVAEVDHARFKDACDLAGQSMQVVGEKLVEAYTASATEAGIRHMNGELCPISQLIIALASTTRAQLEASHAGQR